MADEAKADAKPAPMIFKGSCSEGVLKGKEIEGKLDIKVNVESVKTKDAPPKKTGWDTIFFWMLFLLVANMAAGDPAGMRKYRSPQGSPSSQIFNQSGEQAVLPKQNTNNLPR
ncbi:MAG: hypothetical protein HC786_08830 [Richelia sp. CSU_2_1]|nr:hypothetical protein [Richelia sp. CSU_2_1]